MFLALFRGRERFLELSALIYVIDWGITSIRKCGNGLASQSAKKGPVSRQNFWCTVWDWMQRGRWSLWARSSGRTGCELRWQCRWKDWYSRVNGWRCRAMTAGGGILGDQHNDRGERAKGSSYPPPAVPFFKLLLDLSFGLKRVCALNPFTQEGIFISERHRLIQIEFR